MLGQRLQMQVASQEDGSVWFDTVLFTVEAEANTVMFYKQLTSYCFHLAVCYNYFIVNY